MGHIEIAQARGDAQVLVSEFPDEANKSMSK